MISAQEDLIRQTITTELRMTRVLVPGAETTQESIDAVASMVRNRGAAYAARFRHAGELSWRMPGMFKLALHDGRMTIDHMDAIWRRMDRHPGLRETLDRQEQDVRTRTGLSSWDDFGAVAAEMGLSDAAENTYSPEADRSVSYVLARWLGSLPATETHVTQNGSTIERSPATIHRLREVVDTDLDTYFTPESAAASA